MNKSFLTIEFISYEVPMRSIFQAYSERVCVCVRATEGQRMQVASGFLKLKFQTANSLLKGKTNLIPAMFKVGGGQVQGNHRSELM